MIYSSIDKFHKSIIGAVPEGTSLRLRLCLPSPCVSSAFMVISGPDGCKRIPLYLDEIYWQVDYVFNKEGIYFYHFEYYNHGSDFLFQLYRNDDFSAVPTNFGLSWQQTVYSKDYKTPDEFKKGVVYQIFPDRFNFSGEKKENPFEDRYIAEWLEPLAYTQNPYEKKRLNNDYHCGDLKGIEQKLDYLSDLGVTVIYLNPIFEAHSNHRYNTADYTKIDPLLGDDKDFVSLCEKAHEKGIKIVLDGVFSHTGSDSKYFNLEGRYTGGAYRDDTSPYRDWFTFGENRSYGSWWNIETLPEVNEMSSFCEYICQKGGVLDKWMALGADGFRLDVADELPDEFIAELRKAVKRNNPDALLLGEVWEDASNKESYGKRRKFLYGHELDSVTNYCFRNAIIDYVLHGNAKKFYYTVMGIVENYPKESLDCAFNLLGTHDTERILTVLGSEGSNGRNREWQSGRKMNSYEYEHGKKLLKMAAVLNYTLPGMPLLLYGDEAGTEGYADPFNRAPFDWGNIDEELHSHFSLLGKLRNSSKSLDGGTFTGIYFEKGTAVFERQAENEVLLVAVNQWNEKDEVFVGERFDKAKCVFGNEIKDGKLLIDEKDYAVYILSEEI